MFGYYSRIKFAQKEQVGKIKTINNTLDFPTLLLFSNSIIPYFNTPLVKIPVLSACLG